MRIHEDEKALEGLLQESPALNYVRSLPGMGPILAVVVLSEIDGIERFPSAQKLCGYAGLCPQQQGQNFSRQTTTTLQQMAPLGLRRGRLGCHRLLGLLRGLLQTQASAWQEAQPRHPGHCASDGSNHLAALDAAPGLHSLVKTQYLLRSQPAERIVSAVSVAKEGQKPLKDPSDFPRRKTFP